LPFSGETARESGVLEERDDACVSDRGDDAGRVSYYRTNVGIGAETGVFVASDGKDAER
jgi:hypothetical protein